MPTASDVASLRDLAVLSDSHVEQLHALYQREWWTKDRSLDATRRCVRGSQICLGLVTPSDELVAFARVLTDFTFKALIFDVIVVESWRKLGLGDRLMDRIMGHTELRGVRHFELYCLPELFPFYERHGFGTDVGQVRLMRLARA